MSVYNEAVLKSPRKIQASLAVVLKFWMLWRIGLIRDEVVVVSESNFPEEMECLSRQI
jgi:hypothetical protein